MPNSHALYIGGEWVAGAHNAQPNQNPSDLSDIIGHYDQASAEHGCLNFQGYLFGRPGEEV